MLRHEVLSIDDFRVCRSLCTHISHRIPQLIQRFHNDFEGTPFIVTFKILDVFEHKSSRTLDLKDQGNIKEKRALRLAFKTVGPPECIFL